MAFISPSHDTSLLPWGSVSLLGYNRRITKLHPWTSFRSSTKYPVSWLKESATVEHNALYSPSRHDRILMRIPQVADKGVLMPLRREV